MPIDILMPALSPTMETGTLAKWYVKEGDRIETGELLAEIETDKATMEFEAIEEGTVTKILVAEGTAEIAVNSVIAEITTEDETKIDTKKSIQVKKIASKENSLKSETKLLSATEQLKSNKSDGSDRIKISPVAKKLALTHNVDPNHISGSGPHGRIIKSDILKFIKTNEHLDSEVAAANQTEINTFDKIEDHEKSNDKHVLEMFSKKEYDLIPITGIRKIVANRLSIAKKTIPHFYLERTVHSDRLIKLRAELNTSFEDNNFKFSINDFIIKASAKSLQDNPKCNAVWTEKNILQLKNSDISVAVAIDEGLITPVIFNAQQKSLKEISLEMKDKAKRAREKKLLPEEYTGGSFSISNLGMLGVEKFAAVINPPQASILAVGSSKKRPMANSAGDIYVGDTISVTLSADHRVIDGAVGALFLGSIVEYLSNPLKLII